MGNDTTSRSRLRCTNCGREAPAGEDWGSLTHPPLGTLTQCLECGSTNVHNLD